MWSYISGGHTIKVQQHTKKLQLWDQFKWSYNQVVLKIKHCKIGGKLYLNLHFWLVEWWLLYNGFILFWRGGRVGEAWNICGLLCGDTVRMSHKVSGLSWPTCDRDRVSVISDSLCHGWTFVRCCSACRQVAMHAMTVYALCICVIYIVHVQLYMYNVQIWSHCIWRRTYGNMFKRSSCMRFQWNNLKLN